VVASADWGDCERGASQRIPVKRLSCSVATSVQESSGHTRILRFAKRRPVLSLACSVVAAAADGRDDEVGTSQHLSGKRYCCSAANADQRGRRSGDDCSVHRPRKEGC